MTEDEVQTTRDDCYWTGVRCIRDCYGREDGDYQSCRGCSIYASCTNGNIIDSRPCAYSWPSLQWDDFSKKCKYSSRTCMCYEADDLVKVSDIFAKVTGLLTLLTSAECRLSVGLENVVLKNTGFQEFLNN